MPARNSSMELSSPSNTEGDASLQPSRRKSGRVTKKPDLLSPSFGNRPRSGLVDVDEDVDMDDDGEDGSEEDGSAGEELRERKRKAARVPTRSAKPKRPKLDGTNLAFRPAPKTKRARATQRKSDAAGAGGLYGDVFGEDKPIDAIAMDWLERCRADEAAGVAEVVNFTLRCSGCMLAIDVHDVQDPDHATSKLQDLQDEYQASKIVDYPLIAKGKAAGITRSGIVDFMAVVIKTLAFAEDELLFKQPDILLNIEVWIAALTSATNRPFRHTATVVTLAIVSALCEVAKSLTETRAKTMRQHDGEKKKQKVNQGRVKELRQKSESLSKQLQELDEIITDWFDTVIVHRYRDIDQRIRVDCLTGIMEWVATNPDHFLNGQHLRYLGWMLVDTNAQSRLAIVRGMKKLYRDDTRVAAMGQFTDRFRSRLVEMATSDAEVGVRAASVELLDILREKGLLEPDDIDVVGKLLYDADLKVRAAVIPFFLASVDETFDSKKEDLGNDDELDEELPDPDVEDYEAPRLDWLKLKCLAELMTLYEDSETESAPKKGATFEEAIVTSRGETSFSIAARALISHFEPLQHWEVLAGYLLFDHSKSNADDSVESRFKEACKISDREEIILLDVLNASVQHTLSNIAEDGLTRPTKKGKGRAREVQNQEEVVADRLASIILRLLNKFGASPDTVASVMRLARILNLEVFQELRQDSTTFSTLLDDINTQFTTHDSEAVQAEARAVLLHAKSFPDLREVTDTKMQTLWDETTYTFTAYADIDSLQKRGAMNMDVTYIEALSNTVARLAGLASISDCSTPFEKPRAVVPKKGGRRRTQQASPPVAPVTHLLSILRRGVPVANIDADKDAAEDALVSHTIQACLFYFMWQVQALATKVDQFTQSRLIVLSERYDSFVTLLASIVDSRKGAEETRLAAAGALLDLETIFAKFHRPTEGEGSETHNAFSSMLGPLSESQVKSILDCFASAEREFAKKSSKRLEEPAEDEDPEDFSDSEDEAEEETDSGAVERKRRELLLVEERFISLAGKLVLAILAGVFSHIRDSSGHVRGRVLRNRGRLGANFKQLCAALDEQPAKETNKAKTRNAATTQKSAAIITAEDDEEDEEVAEARVEEQDEDELRQQGLLGDADGDEDGRQDAEPGDTESLLGD